MDKEFLENFSCPVCYEIPKAEIFQCKNGHIVCSTCFPQLPHCPECRESYGEERIRNRALELILTTQTNSSRSQQANGAVYVSENVICDDCEMNPIKGTRHNCLECEDYDLCDKCRERGVHSHHLFTQITNDVQSAALIKLKSGKNFFRNPTKLNEPSRVTWVSKSNGEVPDFAIVAGINSGKKIFVARAYHNRGIIPGGLVEGQHGAMIPYDCREFYKLEYEILVAPNNVLSWTACQEGNVPSNALVGGSDPNGELYYIGRVTRAGKTSVGKVHQQHEALYIALDGKELSYRNYEILIRNDDTSSSGTIGHRGGCLLTC